MSSYYLFALQAFFQVCSCLPQLVNDISPTNETSSPIYSHHTGSIFNPAGTGLRSGKVGIIGAGASGLYSALLLDTLGIEYEILEAGNRAGGRILTHYFDEDKWKISKLGEPDYYDYVELGAMRIPNIPYMARLIGNSSNSLISFLNSHVGPEDTLRLIPYVYHNDAAFYMFNGVRKYLDSPLVNDAFSLVQSPQAAPDISAQFASQDPLSIAQEISADFTAAMSSNFSAGFAKLSEYDGKSTRQYLASSKNFTPAEIDWLETVNDATGHFDLGLPQMVFDQWMFDASPQDRWLTIEGGFDKLTRAMVSLINHPIQFNRIVTSIAQQGNSLQVRTADGNVTEYSHIISTIPLGALQMVDLSGIDIPFEKTNAIRTVNYDAAMKIGMRFKTRWWENLPRPIYGGESFTDLPVRMVVYPSYGLNVTDAPGVLIASYTWAQDAHRLSSYISSDNIPALTALVLHSLSVIHNVSIEMLNNEHISTYPYSWYDSPYSMGGFAAYGPDQFARLLPILAKPAGKGNRFHFAGEGLSAGHQWLIGALDSGLRCVNEILEGEGEAESQQRLLNMWGQRDDLGFECGKMCNHQVVQTDDRSAYYRN